MKYKQQTKIIGITGGKGGTGKSTVASALAWDLSKRHNVLLLDADADCPNDHLLLDITLEDKKTITQRIPAFDKKRCTKCGACAIACRTGAIIRPKDSYPILIQRQCFGCGACQIVCKSSAITWSEKDVGKLKTGKKENLKLMTCELKTNEPVSELVVSAAKEDIEKEKNNYDYIIVDTAAGTHCDVIEALSMCEIALAVTEPTPLGAHDLNLIKDLLKTMRIPNETVINRYEKDTTTPTKARFKIPYSKEIIDAYINSLPIEHESIRNIAEWIESL